MTRTISRLAASKWMPLVAATGGIPFLDNGRGAIHPLEIGFFCEAGLNVPKRDDTLMVSP